MKLLKSTFVGFALLLLMLLSTNASGQRSCGTDELMHQLIKDPEYLKKFLSQQEEIARFIGNGERVPCAAGQTIVIPMAFHFSGGITNGNMSCIMSAINAQIDVLNKDFGGYNTDITTYCQYASGCSASYAPNALGNDACIQFCLATQNLPGGATSAITFGQHTWPTATGWNGIFNVFVSNISPNGNASLLGLAPLGGATDPDGNGMFITASAFGGPGVNCMSGIDINNSGTYNLGRTGTHEAGHYFGLEHLFNGCVSGGMPDFDDNNGDGLADTPQQSTENGGSPTVTGCTSTALNTCGTNDFSFNYMDYVNDAAMFMFTANQMSWMKANADMGTWATNTVTCSGAHTPTYPVGGCPAQTAPTSAFTHNYAGQALCAAQAQIQFTDASSGFPTGWNWTFSGAGVSPTSSTMQNPTVTYSASGTLTATLTANNGAGSGAPSSQMITVIIENPANCGNCGQTFTDNGGPSGNYAPMNAVYTLCASSPSDVVTVSFSQIALEPLPAGNTFDPTVTDHVRIYNGPTATGSPAYTMLTFNSGTGAILNSAFMNIGSSVTSTQQCMTFQFVSTGTATFPGWTGLVSCAPIPTCSDGIQNQGETFVDCGGSTCMACGSLCNNFNFTDAGGLNGPAGSTSRTWTACADATTDKMIVDFDLIDMMPFNNGILRVFNGTTTDGSFTYYISGNAIYNNTSPLSPLGSNTITSTGQCFTFQYFNGSNTSVGWDANFNCCSSGSCPNATNNGTAINTSISTSCPGYSLSNFTSFTDRNGSDRVCTNPSLPFSAFYVIQCDGSGGNLGIDVSANSSGGNVQAGLYGPVTGGCPTYAGGSFVDCEDGTNPAALTTTAGPNAKYILVVTSENPGDFSVVSTSNSTALPVVWKSFKVEANETDVLLNWNLGEEINNKGFLILRSQDGRLFDNIGEVPFEAKMGGNYSFVDNGLKDGWYFYKIQQIDLDGRTSYSDTKSVKISTEDNAVKIFPNPANSNLIIEGAVTTSQIDIVDAVGKLYSLKVDSSKKINSIDISSIPNGVYLVTIPTEQGIIFERLIIAK